MGVRLVGEPPRRLTPARRRLIEVLSDGLLHGKSEAAREAGVSAGVIDGLVDEGTLTIEPMPPPLAPPAPDPSFAQPEFLAPAAHRGGRHARARRQWQLSTSRCSTASPARARPKSISRRSPKSSAAASSR